MTNFPDRSIWDSDRRTIELPLILGGRIVKSADRQIHRLDYEHNIQVTVPAMEETDLELISEQHAEIGVSLGELSTDEVTQYLARVGERWLARTSAARRLADENSSSITGLPPSMLASDYETLGHLLTGRFHTWEQIEAEFGNDRIFDEWVPRQMTWIRAFARGLVVHYLVGNLPLAGLYSILRGIISRNCTLAKLPTRDPLSVNAFAQALIEEDPEHPIALSLSVAYWPHEAKIGQQCLSAADAVCVWGGEDAVKTVRRSVRANVPVAEYGPRWSASVIDLDQCNPDEAALRLVEDVAFYDQEACFSSQRAFIHGGVAALAAFREALPRYFDLFSQRHPSRASSSDALANRAAAILEAGYLGLDVDEGFDWAIVMADEATAITVTHPLTRTLVICLVESLSRVTLHLDKSTQTVGVFPWELALRYRDDWARAGAERLVPLGWSRLPRAGWTHDGGYGMHPLVRLVSLERPRNEFGKHYPRPSDPMNWERRYLLGEQWAAAPPGMASVADVEAAMPRGG
ncbi:MAG TPA: acyl-CoA reductase [Solirubrobacteraceae bacterium]|jgi:long-chain-fatty-acyl-CoA reductase|nr:acyl-CoA reductase [Solirubrobacteraceae bacterium]